ncbi:MAG: flagellar protein [Syntrophomonadaceae bacterium]|nr:flagellar protein [Syntrophomonadaceae bacterium]
MSSLDNRISFPQQQIVQPSTSRKDKSVKSQTGTNFGQVLDQKLQGELKFSQHARERLKSRNIELSAGELDKLQDAVIKARQKGARDSLILMQDLALVVSVKNNTVVTAVDGQNLKENIFTNIDSAVII